MQLGVDHWSSRIIDTYVAASVKVVDSKVASATAVMVDSSVTVMVVPIIVVDAAVEHVECSLESTTGVVVSSDIEILMKYRTAPSVTVVASAVVGDSQ